MFAMPLDSPCGPVPFKIQNRFISSNTQEVDLIEKDLRTGFGFDQAG